MTMQIIDAQSPEAHSADLKAENIDKLKALFPELITEGPNGVAVNQDVLKQLVGDATVTDADEKYGLNWHGKRAARQLALTPSTGTLLPCPDESVDWDTTQNLMIEGDNLEVLKLLQKSYAGKVKLIYIDPPYNTGKDFVYPDNFQDNIKNYLELTGQIDGGANISSNTETNGRFHTDWLNMIYPRLKLARNLLCDDGVIFITIDNSEIDNLTSVLKELMGQENFATTFIWEKRRSRENRKLFSVNHDYVVCFTKNKDAFELVRGLLPLTDEARNRYGNIDNDPRGDWQSVAITAQAGHGTKSQFYTITTPGGRQVDPPSGNCWRFTEDRLAELIADNRIWFGTEGNNVPRQKVFLSEQEEGLTPHTIWTADEVGTTDSAKRELNSIFDGYAVFDTPKSVGLVQRMIDIGCAKDGLILDFFAGSGTTAEAVWRANLADGGHRRAILVQLPEPLDPDDKDQKIAADFCSKLGKPLAISELTKERLRRCSKKLKAENPLFNGDTGFRVFKLDASNISAWNPSPIDLERSLLDSQEHILPDRSEADILTELLLKLGLDLCVPIEQQQIAGKTVHSIGGGVLLACLTEQITRDQLEDLAQGIVAWHKAQAPASDSTCVFRDSAFADDIAKTNLAAILDQAGIKNVRSL
ncbi:site-specific DNA-methyltransferase [Pseudomonas oryzihabitans]|uniref:site-specific DNA-methyltransferase n=1 Tax=Pseudomonas oryzihabitans TaxID=47885 RepID=UPI00215956C5|nr:site-specific DNA-methyltransferase [Pseudomonas psychrotolerans]